MKQRRFRRIQATIALASAALVIVTALVLAGLSFTFTRDAVENTALEFTSQLVLQVATNIDSYITHMTNISNVVQANDQVREYFGTDWTENDDGRRVLAARVESFLSSVALTRDDISLILIARSDGQVLSNRSGVEVNPAVSLTDEPFFAQAVTRPDQPVISSSHVQNIVAGDYRWVISVSRTVDGLVNDAEQTVLLVDLTFSVISDLVSQISLGNRGYLFIIDDAGRIVYHPRQELIYSGIETEYIDRVLATDANSFTVDEESRTRIYNISRSARTGWRIVGVNYMNELVGSRDTIERYYIVSTLVLVALSIVIAVLISHRVSKPLLTLRESMKQVERGEFNRTVEVRAANEIGELAEDYNIMIAKIRELMRRNAEESEQKRRSELHALQNQITPHFLYNTLDSIIWMAEGKQYGNVVTTVSALARLLRLSVSRGDELITARDEIEHVRSYLTIQKLRYRDRLDFEIDVNESVLRRWMPKVVLQPLVENAIYHGIKNKETGGKVVVAGRDCGDSIVLSVHDDGVGMDAERLTAQLRSEPQQQSDRKTRVGVRNVHDRIQLYFGTEYGLEFESTPESGTTVFVRIPVVEADHVDESTLLEAVR